MKTEHNQSYPIICEPEIFNKFLSFKPEAAKVIKWEIYNLAAYNTEILKLDSFGRGYCIQSHIWTIYNEFQSAFYQKRFKIYEQWETPKYIPHSAFTRKPFVKVFDTFLLHIFSSGLVTKWNNDFYLGNFIHHIVKGDFNNNLGRKMKLADTTFPLYLWLIGLCLSLLFFLGELFVNRFCKS